MDPRALPPMPDCSCNSDCLPTASQFKPKPRKRKKSVRKGLSKSLRFSVFSRDGFTCRYCGRQSDEVKLVVDHLKPVCQGGTNDEANLITSCEECNQGKGGKTIAQAAPTEQDRLRVLQEHREQVAIAEAASRAAKFREELRQTVCNVFCEAFGWQEMRKQNLGLLVSFAEQYTPDRLFQWIGIAATRLRGFASESSAMRYICGIRRNYVAQEEGK